MIKNPQDYIFPDVIRRNFKKNKIAQKVYENFVLLHLKKYSKQKIKLKELKNILHINTAVGKGGAAKVAYEFLNKNYQKLGFDSSIICTANYGDSQDDIIKLKENNIKLHKLLHRYSKNKGLLDFFNLESFNVENYKQFINSDVIHLHNLHGSYFSTFALPKLTSLKPTIWTLHDEQSFTGHCAYSFDCSKWQQSCGNCPDLNYYPKIKTDTTELLISLKKKIYDLSHFTVACPSEWLANKAKSSILRNKDLRVIYNGINPDIFKPTEKMQARKSLGLPLDKKILMFSASGSINNPQKGGEYILQAYEKLKDNNDILFLNLGGNNSKSKKNWIDVPYINEESKLALYYSAADLFIYPSQAEAFGLVVAESLACQTPVVAFNNTALPEIIDHMQNGYLAKNKDIKDFISGINLLLSNSELSKKSGLSGREKVIKNFTLEKMISNYIELYQEVIEKF